MSTNPSEHSLPEHDIDALSIEPRTIEGYARETHDIENMYQTLHTSHPELAEYLRMRAAKLSPDLAQRARNAQLALEIIELISRQQTNRQNIASLEHLFSLELAPETLRGDETATP